jgi:hypothetical protein
MLLTSTQKMILLKMMSLKNKDKGNEKKKNGKNES